MERKLTFYREIISNYHFISKDAFINFYLAWCNLKSGLANRLLIIKLKCQLFTIIGTVFSRIHGKKYDRKLWKIVGEIEKKKQ